MKRIGVNVLHSPVKSLQYVTPRPAPRLVPRKDNRPFPYLPYISLMILVTAALGALTSKAFDLLFDARPFAGMSRNAAMRRGSEICQGLTSPSAQTVSAVSISTIAPKTGIRHDEWEISCRDEDAMYALKLDAQRDRLICFQKEPRAIGAKSEGTTRSEIGDRPEFSRDAAIEIGRRYLIATGLAAGTPHMAVRTVGKTSSGRLWDVFCVYTDVQGERRKARIGVACKDGSLDRFQTW